MKTCVIAPIGMSPPVITEMAEYLIKAESKFVSDIILIATANPEVSESIELVKAALQTRYPKIQTHTVKLPFSDISSVEDNIEFMRICANAIREERVKHRCTYIYLNVAGGRKDMCISLSLLSQFIDVDGVFHIIHPDVAVFNQMLERIRKEISDLYVAEDKVSFYEKHKQEFDEVMFPPLNSFNVIQIPTIPFPREELGKIAKILCLKSPAKKEEVELGVGELGRLEKAGLISLTKNRVYPTDFGRMVASLWVKQ